MTTRTILHVDLDAFFAAVEQRDNPELRGRPVVVGGGGPNDRGVVSTASYEARRFGIHSAMPLRTAAALCPDAVFVPVHGSKYQAVSRQVMAVLRQFTDRVEPISIDEAFLDVGGSRDLFGDGETIARRIKQTVTVETGLTVSVGVATTKLVAKIASDLRKPDGLVVVPPGEESAFLAPLPISRLWGVGPQTANALREYGVRTIGDLAALSPDLLVRRFGRHGAGLRDRALGLDDDPVSGGDAAKSIGHEHTFDVDTNDRETIERALLAMSEGVSGRLRAAGLKAGTVTVKIRDSSFHTVTRQRPLAEPTDLTEPIWQAALELARPEVRGIRIRLLGVTATHLGAPQQLSLFDRADDRRRRVVEAADTVRRRYGDKAMMRARLIGSALPTPFERDPMTSPERRVGVHAEPEPRQRAIDAGLRNGEAGLDGDAEVDTAEAGPGEADAQAGDLADDAVAFDTDVGELDTEAGSDSRADTDGVDSVIDER